MWTGRGEGEGDSALHFRQKALTREAHEDTLYAACKTDSPPQRSWPREPLAEARPPLPRQTPSDAHVTQGGLRGHRDPRGRAKDLRPRRRQPLKPVPWKAVFPRSESPGVWRTAERGAEGTRSGDGGRGPASVGTTLASGHLQPLLWRACFGTADAPRPLGPQMPLALQHPRTSCERRLPCGGVELQTIREAWRGASTVLPCSVFLTHAHAHMHAHAHTHTRAWLILLGKRPHPRDIPVEADAHMPWPFR